jgi:hypothetical protein
MVTFRIINPIVPTPSAPKLLALITTMINIINIVNTLEKKVDKIFPNIIKPFRVAKITKINLCYYIKMDPKL